MYNAKLKTGNKKSSNSIRGHPYKSPSANSKQDVITLHKPIGILNTENTCYANASIQALIGLPGFNKDINDLKNELNKDESKPYIEVATPFIHAFQASENSNLTDTSTSVYFIKKDIEVKDIKFRGNRMQDASEFLTKVLELMQDNLSNFHKRNPDLSHHTFPTVIEKNFKSERVELFQCQECKNMDTNLHEDLQFFCTLPAFSGVESPVQFEKLFASIFETDELRERNCQECGHAVALTTIRLVKIPPVLVVTLKIFDFQEGEMTSKVVRPVTLPEKLNLAKFVSGHVEEPNSEVAGRLCPQTDVEEAAQLKAALKMSLLPACTENSTIYKLASVVRHYGKTTESGHYIADVLRAGSWFRCDDTIVSQVNQFEVCNGETPYNPYIVMYVRADDMESIPAEESEVSQSIDQFEGSTSEQDNLANRVKRDLFKTTEDDNLRECLSPMKSNGELMLFKKPKPDVSPEYPIKLNLSSIYNFKQEVGDYLLVDPLTIDIIVICLKSGKKYVATDISQVAIKSAYVCIKVRRDKKFLLLSEK